MTLKEQFRINYLFINDVDIEPIYSERYGETYRFRRLIEVPHYPDYYLIPNYLNYAINRDGVVIKSLNLRNGEIAQYNSNDEAAEKTGCNRNTVHSQCVSRINQANNGYVFRYSKPDEYFPEFTPLQHRLYQHSNFQGRQQPGCLLLNEDGTEYLFGTIAEVLTHLGYKTRDALHKLIRTNKTVRGKKVIYIDPNGIVP